MRARGPNIPPPVIWLPPAAGAYTTGLFNGTSASGAVLSANRLYAIPCVLPSLGTYSDIAINVTTPQAASVGHVGIYRDSSGLPGALLEDLGTFTPTATQDYNISFAANRTITPGLCWLVIAVDTASIQVSRSAGGGSYVIQALAASASYRGYVAHTTADALPDPFGAITLETNNQSPWRLRLKVA